MVKTYLKKPDYGDLKFIRRLWSDPPTMKEVGGTVVLTDSQAEQWYHKMITPGSSGHCYRIILNKDFQPVGEVSFHDYDDNSGKARFNVKILADCRGSGYGKSAIYQLLDYFFNRRGGMIMEDYLALNNDKGREVLIKFGFQWDQTRKDVVRLFLTNKDFNKLYPSSFEH
ncbi:MAG: hypothetical protein APR63_05945 [Desulfuromonas sp. SDB]|nr:MAG: hypothetical protein APR63_05945 [Desulfuromonas sp. SDB]